MEQKDWINTEANGVVEHFSTQEFAVTTAIAESLKANQVVLPPEEAVPIVNSANSWILFDNPHTPPCFLYTVKEYGGGCVIDDGPSSALGGG